jgi:hypothetical protein
MSALSPGKAVRPTPKRGCSKTRFRSVSSRRGPGPHLGCADPASGVLVHLSRQAGGSCRKAGCLRSLLTRQQNCPRDARLDALGVDRHRRARRLVGLPVEIRETRPVYDRGARHLSRCLLRNEPEKMENARSRATSPATRASQGASPLDGKTRGSQTGTGRGSQPRHRSSYRDTWSVPRRSIWPNRAPASPRRMNRRVRARPQVNVPHSRESSSTPTYRRSDTRCAPRGSPRRTAQRPHRR